LIKFGENVKNSRLKKKMTLQQLSNLSGVSKTMLSEVERDKKIPTIEVACKIADALDINLLKLLGKNSRINVSIIRRKERIRITGTDSRVEIYPLALPLSADSIGFFFSTMAPNAITEPIQDYPQSTREYIAVAQGTLQIILGNESVFVLNAGDSMVYDANVERRFQNIGLDNCHYYFVATYCK
jgi:transcriptional regulator with XRE-family HTH domain